jgi:hypothetical protein
MENPIEQPKKLSVKREEMRFLMSQMGAEKIFGIDLVNIAVHSSILESLAKKEILHPGGETGSIIDPQIHALLDTIFFPEQVLLVLRDQRGDGRRFFQIFSKGRKYAYHCFPNDREHFAVWIPKPADILPLIMDWFPFYLLPYSPAKFQLKKTIFDEMLSLAIAGKKDEALNVLSTDPLNLNEKKKLISAMADLKFSGSIARYALQNKKVEAVDSIGVLSDGRTGWLILQENSAKQEGILLSVQRTGTDFAAAVRGMVETFSESTLPRRQPDSVHKTTHFSINLDEFSAALAAINCPDLSKKMYYSLSGDPDGIRYSDRMKKAQNTLFASGLCTVTKRGDPVISEDLAQAVFPIAAFDSTIQIAGSDEKGAINLTVYIVRGRFFTAYRNYGEQLQSLECGKYTDLISYFEVMFPDIGMEKGIQKTSDPISYETLLRANENRNDRKKAEIILTSDGMADVGAQSLAEDLSETKLKAALRRWDSPVKRKNTDEIEQPARGEYVLMLQTSPRRSWLFEFEETAVRGKAFVADRKAFIDALKLLVR